MFDCNRYCMDSFNREISKVTGGAKLILLSGLRSLQFDLCSLMTFPPVNTMPVNTMTHVHCDFQRQICLYQCWSQWLLKWIWLTWTEGRSSLTVLKSFVNTCCYVSVQYRCFFMYCLLWFPHVLFFDWCSYDGTTDFVYSYFFKLHYYAKLVFLLISVDMLVIVSSTVDKGHMKSLRVD